MHAYLSKAGVLAISLSTPGAELRRIMVCRVCPLAPDGRSGLSRSPAAPSAPFRTISAFRISCVGGQRPHVRPPKPGNQSPNCRRTCFSGRHSARNSPSDNFHRFVREIAAEARRRMIVEDLMKALARFLFLEPARGLVSRQPNVTAKSGLS
jgi:hypothetical protein